MILIIISRPLSYLIDNEIKTPITVPDDIAQNLPKPHDLKDRLGSRPI